MIPPSPLVDIQGLSVHFQVGGRGFLAHKRRTLHAVDDVSLTIGRGETVGLIGESGSGKSTLGRTLLRVHAPAAGRIRFDGEDVATLDDVGLRRLRRRSQMIFQDPSSALNPRMTVGASIAEHLRNQGFGTSEAIRRRTAELFDLIGLSPALAERFPHELSGGQRQRIVIARAIATEPDLVVADEPVSALDVSIRAQIINLIRQLQKRMNLALLFISHDLGIVAHVSQRIAVMYLGKIVEIADRETLFRAPLHPYTHALLSAVPVPDPRREKSRARLPLAGEIPSPIDLPVGCRLQTRCPKVTDRCRREQPPLAELAPGHWVACYVPGPPVSG